MTRHSRQTVAATAGGFILALALLALPAQAADAVFPLGSRVGLVPPPGMVVSQKFTGFADPDKNAAILITTLPAAAYAQIEKTLHADSLKRQGVSVDRREPMQLTFGKGLLFVGRQTAENEHFRKWLLVAAVSDLTALVSVQIPEEDKTYSEESVRAALASLAVRATVPEEEELRLLPFKIGDLAGFHVNNVLPGRAVVLADTPSDGSKPAPDKDHAADGARTPDKDQAPDKDQTPDKAVTGEPLDARFLIAAVPGGPSEPDDRANFARLAFNEIGGIKDIHLSVAEPLRIGGQPGYQMIAQAKDARSGGNVMVAQWLRFGSSGSLQMIGIGPVESWPATLSRFRTVRDSIEPK